MELNLESKILSRIATTKKPPFQRRFLGVDPAGFAPASSCVKDDMLLHTPRARIQGVYVNKKAPVLQGALLLTHDFNPVMRTKSSSLEPLYQIKAVNVKRG